VVPVGVDDGGEGATELSGGPALTQNWPNPFNPVTTIAFEVPALDDGAAVRLTVHTVGGSLVRTLVDEPLAAGRHTVVWDGLDDRGVRSASGVYFCRLEVGERTAGVRKMSLLK
jgi:flagellar hook assembly protein FlgD